MPHRARAPSIIAMLSTDSRPLVGLTLDAETAGHYSAYEWYALRANYASAVIAAGGLPVALPHAALLAESYISKLDALVVTGGAFDIDPSLYGVHERHPTVSLKENRTAAELALIEAALERDIPVLGICGGEQLLAVILGGTLIQHIPDEVPNALEHEQKKPHHVPCHEVTIVPGTRLHRIVGVERMQVNSSHHQAVAKPGPHAHICARAPDGVIEAIEDPRFRFCLGVQWHPEFGTDPKDPYIFKALIDACRK